jgi:hypothetical protein
MAGMGAKQPAALEDKERAGPGRQSLSLVHHFEGNTTSTGNTARLFSEAATVPLRSTATYLLAR